MGKCNYTEVFPVYGTSVEINNICGTSVELSTAYSTSVEVSPNYSNTSIELGFFSRDRIEPNAGVTFIQDHPPEPAKEKNIWYNPLTLQTKVYHDGAWAPVSPDGGYF